MKIDPPRKHYIPVDEWPLVTCSSGTVIYHNTSQKSVVNIVTYGIKPVQNAWGGGLLGAGFYTHVVKESAEVYGDKGFTIELIVTSQLVGRIVPRSVIARGIQGYSYRNGNAFLTNEDDLKEFKFHSGEHLEISKIHNTSTGEYSLSTYLFLEKISSL